MIKNKIQFLFSSILLIISAFLNVYLAFLLQMIIDATSSNNVKALIRPIVLTLVFMLLDLTVAIISKYSCTTYIQKSLEAMKSKRFQFVLSQSDKHGQNDSKKELSSFNTDIDIVERDYSQEQFNIILYSAQFIMALVAIISISWVITLTIALITVILIIVPTIFQNKIQNLQDNYSESTSKYTMFVGESLSSKQDIIAYNVTQPLMEKHNQLNHVVEKKRKKVRFASSALATICSNVGFLSFVSALGIGAYYVIKGQMTFGYMIAAIQLMNSLMNPLNNLLEILIRFKASKNIVGKFRKDPEKAEKVGNEMFGFKDEVSITDLNFSYEENKPIIENFNLTLKRGQKIALIGSSGSGKSTIAKILAREITEYNGRVCIDGVSIQDIDMDSYRDNIRFMRQSPSLFTDTVLNNVLFFQTDYKEEDLNEALRLSRVNSFIQTPDDEQRMIDSTSGLSGGQIQRLMISRALLHKSPILILDEFTSALDMNTADEIIRDVLQITDITCLVITHKCDEKTLEMFDQVIRLN